MESTNRCAMPTTSGVQEVILQAQTQLFLSAKHRVTNAISSSQGQFSSNCCISGRTSSLLMLQPHLRTVESCWKRLFGLKSLPCSMQTA
jgi:hypothetical protein